MLWESTTYSLGLSLWLTGEGKSQVGQIFHLTFLVVFNMYCDF